MGLIRHGFIDPLSTGSVQLSILISSVDPIEDQDGDGSLIWNG